MNNGIGYVVLITYNFDSDYVAVPCTSIEEAKKILHKLLEDEIETVKTECEYTPIVNRYPEWDGEFAELIYEEEMALGSDAFLMNVATYRVIDLNHNPNILNNL